MIERENFTTQNQQGITDIIENLDPKIQETIDALEKARDSLTTVAPHLIPPYMKGSTANEQK